jgi:hypothetical protein
MNYKMKLKYDTENNISEFPNNIGIGFFIIPNGWDGSKVKNTMERIYTYEAFNQNNSIQTILLSDLFSSNDQTGKMILSFEDIYIPGGDKDYNDLIFKIDYTPSYAIYNKNLNKLPSYCYHEDSLVFCKNIISGEESYQKVKDITEYTHHVYSTTKNKFIPFLLNSYIGKRSDNMCVIKKNSLGENLPFENFYITKKHPIFLNGKEIMPKKINNIERAKMTCKINTICTYERDYILINGISVTTWKYEDFIKRTFNNV